MNQIDQSKHHAQDDAIDLHKFLRIVWAVRYAVLLAVLVVTVGYWGYWSVKVLLNPPLLTYGQVVHFTFEGVDKAQYPNESPFHISDIIAPNLLSQIYDSHELSKQGISESQFISKWKIIPYSPEQAFILKRYRSFLDQRNIRPEEVRKLQQEMSLELNQAGSRSALLSFEAQWGTLERKTINSILQDLPRQWAKKAVDEYGVLELDVPIYSKEIFNEQRYKVLDYAVAIDLIQTNIALIQNSIEELLKHPHSKRVIDEESSYSLPGLQKLIADIISYDLATLTAFIEELGISNDREVVEIYYEYQIRKLIQKKDAKAKQSELIHQTLLDYIQQGRNKTNKTSPVPESESAVDVFQIGGDFLDRLSTLIKRSEDLEYRQNLYDLSIDHRQEEVKIDLEIAEKQAFIDAFKQKDKDTALDKKYVEVLEKKLPLILSKLREYIDLFSRLHSALSKENFGYSTALYRLENEDDGGISSSLIGIQDLLIYAILVFVISSGTLIIAIMARYLKEAD